MEFKKKNDLHFYKQREKIKKKLYYYQKTFKLKYNFNYIKIWGNQKKIFN